MSDFRLTTPVAFIIFNRPDTTARVFAEIAKAKPGKLLIIGDGARAHRPGEAEKVAAARAIASRVDWECEVLTNLSDVNLGCKRRVASGLDWVFEQVEEAIILEDDCLPDPSFFRYCQEMLARYRTDDRIGMVSGDNFQFGRRYGDDSYYFSKYVHIWGWATWRDRWVSNYDVGMKAWADYVRSGTLPEFAGRGAEARYWRRLFDRVYRGLVDTWDTQWVFANWRAAHLTVLPQVNLISNIGFSLDATHTRSYGDLADMPAEAIRFPLRHPEMVVRNVAADRRSDRLSIRLPLWKRLFNKVAVWIR